MPNVLFILCTESFVIVISCVLTLAIFEQNSSQAHYLSTNALGGFHS